MTSQAFPIAALVLGHDADPSQIAAITALAAMARDLGAAPVVVAVPPGIELPAPARVVRTRVSGSRIGAIRLGMAQLANTPARVVLLLPQAGSAPSLVTLLSLVDAAKRAPDSLVAFAGAPLDESPVLVPRDAWLELVTVAENGLDAVAARRRVERVAVPHG
ncbi:MAG TPA: hypothetical protein VF461_03920 [Gemmatimonadaceae bacterium]